MNTYLAPKASFFAQFTTGLPALPESADAAPVKSASTATSTSGPSLVCEAPPAAPTKSAEPYSPSTGGLHKPRAHGASLRPIARSTPRTTELPTPPPASPPPTGLADAKATSASTADAVPDELAADTTQAQPPAPPLETIPIGPRPSAADVEAATAYLEKHLNGSWFDAKEFVGEASTGAKMADTMSPSVARALRDMDRTGTLLSAITDADKRDSMHPQILKNTVLSALQQFDLRGVTHATSDIGADRQSGKSWLTAQLADSCITGGKNSMTDRDATRFLADNLAPAAARGLAKMRDSGELDEIVKNYCQKNGTSVPDDLVASRITDALSKFATL